ncbi:hydroquinone glucosyltransferase [Cajanus cajan]|uniref:Glycosyltransferase n=1 Tax=Cajanus cajan TaxID=3821 RepID=A0A151QYH9_CAJCA|nr:hydroquinone glucosyltransferase [Cajanus cajan]KYP35370.1 Hydroquinone glucosyltransferase [Cajanus cajan]
MAATTHIAIVTVPVYSHLRSILEFSKRLVHLHHDINVTCINPTFGSPCNNTKSLFDSLPSTINYMFLPPINLEDLPHDTHPAIQVQVTISRSLPLIYDALKTLHASRRLVAVISDGLMSQVLHFGKELDTLSYTYFPSTAMLLSLCLYSSMLDKTISCEYKDLLEPMEIPGCIPILGTDLPDPLQDRSGVAYKEFLEGNERFYLADGILVNNFYEIEEETIKALQQEEGRGIPSVYAIGPFVQQKVACNDESDKECLRWLDKQQHSSVLYVSFGSGGTLSHDQINELALGLELSGQRFLWVLRPPNKFGIINDIGAKNEDPFQFLPEGFLQRTEGSSLVVPYWASQVEILGHGAIGGFLCHCGWNSTLEGVVLGVPLIAWPLFAEQKMNAVLLTNGLKVALRVKVNEKGIVEREEVARVIKNLMVGEEGEEIRKRMKKLEDAAANALKDDGSSTRTLTQLVHKWKRLTLGVA